MADRSLDAGLLVAFILFLNQIFRPLRMIADKFNVLQMGMVAAERVFKILDNQDVTLNEGTHAPEKIQGKIEFQNVCFAYNEPNFVLKNINFTVQAGETIALVGQTGSGKTAAFLLPTLNGLANQDTLVPFKDRMKAITQPNILVISPTFKKIKPEFFTIVNEIAAQNKVKLVDYSNAEEFVSQKTLFHDSEHLNDKGAFLFSKEVAKQINP